MGRALGSLALLVAVALTTGFAVDRVNRVVRSHQGEVRACYLRELVRHPDLEGRIVMHWVISPEGVVVTSEVEESTMDHPAVGECIARAARLWIFPRGDATEEVRYPFRFSR
jgi:hypothetical protein